MLLSMLTKFWRNGIRRSKRAAIKGSLCSLRARKKGAVTSGPAFVEAVVKISRCNCNSEPSRWHISIHGAILITTPHRRAISFDSVFSNYTLGLALLSKDRIFRVLVANTKIASDTLFSFQLNELILIASSLEPYRPFPINRIAYGENWSFIYRNNISLPFISFIATVLIVASFFMVAVLAVEEKYNEAISSSAKRLVAAIDGLPDPGGPQFKDNKRESNFKSREETEEK
ncbi:hypothetical protein F3Y22_tig00111151pilonHSYRG00114 [Hibiscus syriacus]|uniref:Uncharacterized protein n=1 Tax=Hibiscus syriacus TaxID=106335 RepID=A0A6A2YXH6_HIBSY|nr:hypothetical protein F3Y22_tig00111151pilonHSYRG00114 [Hibiscus syriacus]